MKEKVYTQFDRPKTIPTEPGTHYINLYQEEITKSGSKELVKIGERDVWAEIQAEQESVQIENILHAVAMGDLSALNQREAMYVDATTMPKTLMEAQNIVIKAKQEFESFPLEVRKLFNNSPEEYVSEMGSKEFLDKLAPYNAKMAAIKEAGSMKEYEERVKQQAKFEKDVAAAKGVTTNADEQKH